MKSIVYWSPFLTKIATIKSVLNSAIILKKKKKELDIYIINCIGEWCDYEKKIKSNNLIIINLFNFNLHKYLPKDSYLKSRFSLIVISVIVFFPLIFFLIKKKPNFFISHLNTLLIIFLSNFFKTKFIIRISGYPKLHFLRRLLWKSFSNKIYCIISPTETTKQMLIKSKIFEKKKIYKVEDPVFNLKKKYILKKNQFKLNKNSFNNILAIGRLTEQKNFSFLIKCFRIIENKYPNRFILNILGEGEERKNLSHLINNLHLDDKVNLIGYKSNVNYYLKKSFCFILSSLWEDPGFVLIEAAINKTFILSSNCPNGPKDFLANNKGGILFASNNMDDFTKKFDFMLSLNNIQKKKIINYSFKKAKAYTLEEHYCKISRILFNDL
jgi:glycosyltransferase involved in cell wall biosynthesis